MLIWRSAESNLFRLLRDVGLWLSDVRFHLRSATDRSCRYSERQFVTFGILGLVLIPATVFIERAVVDVYFDTIYLRVMAGLVGLLFVFHHRLPQSLKSNMDLVWVGSVAFVFPFCYGAMLALNAASTPHETEPSQIWVYQYIVALFIFVQLTNSGAVSILLWLLSTICVLLVCFLLVQDPNLHAIREAWLFPLPVYLTALIIGSISNRNIHVVQAEQLRAASAIGSNLAHELRTPLASIRLFARAISRVTPELIESHHAANSAGLPVPEISPIRLDQLNEALTSIQSEVNYSNTVIDMLLLNSSENSISNTDFEVFPVSLAIKDAVARFPFNNSYERTLVRYSTDPDFHVFAPRLFLVHVFFNIIKNGVYYVQNAGKGDLSIGTGSAGGNNMVTITDTGPGIPRSLQHRIFERFFSTVRHGQGAGIGLSFCKMAMEAIGGEIICESKEGEYTTFRLMFPPVDHIERG